MGEQELVLAVSEVFQVAVTCSKCSHGITFNASNGDTGLPAECPVCRADFRKVGELLGGYRRFYLGAVDSPHSFQFRIRVGT